MLWKATSKRWHPNWQIFGICRGDDVWLSNSRAIWQHIRQSASSRMHARKHAWCNSKIARNDPMSNWLQRNQFLPQFEDRFGTRTVGSPQEICLKAALLSQPINSQYKDLHCSIKTRFQRNLLYDGDIHYEINLSRPRTLFASCSNLRSFCSHWGLNPNC